MGELRDGIPAAAVPCFTALFRARTVVAGGAPWLLWWDRSAPERVPRARSPPCVREPRARGPPLARRRRLPARAPSSAPPSLTGPCPHPVRQDTAAPPTDPATATVRRGAHPTMPTPSTPHPLLALALDGAGWHPAAWREPDARPAELFTAGYWADLVARGRARAARLRHHRGRARPAVRRARSGPTSAPTRCAGRLDAVLIAARVAPLTRHIGLVPTAVVTHTEPFHVVQGDRHARLREHRPGRRAGAGVRPARRGRALRPPQHPADRAAATDEPGRAGRELFDEAADYVEVVRRLWDSWEDDAEIRDVATGRFIDRDKLHYIDFEGQYFSVKGPSITPRPPQGQPIVAALAHRPMPYRLVGAGRRRRLRHPARRRAGRARSSPRSGASRPPPGAPAATVHVVRRPGGVPRRRRRRGRGPPGPARRAGRRRVHQRRPDLRRHPGAAGRPARRSGSEAGLAGFRLRPPATAHDLPLITRGLVPELQRRGAFRTAYAATTLRELLGLARPANRYATA